MINFGNVPAGSVLPIQFATYGKTNGESITLTGLAVTDIEVYKGTSMTQRSSDAGYTLLDTDGIDIDGVTGIHGFSIDLGDNTDAGFYAAGSFYTVVVSAVTIDSQTVNFIAATFRIVAAENSAGTPVADITRINGSAATLDADGSVTGTVAASPSPSTTSIDVTLGIDRATGYFDRAWLGLTSGSGNAQWRRVTTHTRVSATVGRFAFSGSTGDPDAALATAPTAADTVRITGRG